MGDIIRLLAKIFPQKFVSGILKSEYKNFIMFILSLSIAVLFGYTLLQPC